MRYLMKIAYDGTDYYGWQRQISKPTIEATIENCLSQILNQKTLIYGAGRTDAGVHAYGQCAHFDSDKELDLAVLRNGLNSLLPKSIHIISLEVVPETFHARHSASGKHYRYRINLQDENPFDRFFSYTIRTPAFDIDKLKAGAELFIGDHYFFNYTVRKEDERNFHRFVKDIRINTENKILTLDFFADGFMQYQVRMMVGTLIALAEGKIELEDIRNSLQDGIRRPISYKAPAQGLVLVEVFYER
ncbi:MAG TPA: tRNA pseudouridine(38-40) synthase TruA [Bacilli bacterium]|nr:tRNA pseudouridine(38-40) synthase TruA [Bacilli bacterium]